MVDEILNVPFWWGTDRTIGLLYFLLGISGASIMIYIGEWDRLLGTSSIRLQIEENIEYMKKKLDNNDDISEFDTIWKSINKEEEALYKEIKRGEFYGAIIYLFVGGIVAMILATDLVEAIAFGAGWTGFLGTFLVKKDEEKRQKIRNIKYDDIQKKVFEDFESKLKDKVASSYYRGYTDAIGAVASSENRSFDEILKNIKSN
ncbi:MAG: hypothetical protein RBR63_08685 [Methanosarcina vacuolata]|nr:hypothetical protein [Methanosarcina vacuolata]